MLLLDGKQLAQTIREEIAEEVGKIKSAGGKNPHLAAVLVGNDGASETYVAGKVKACEATGIESTLIRMDESTTQEALLQKVDDLNNNNDIDGFIVQLPLPGQINVSSIIEAIKPEKDVDGFHPVNVGRMMQNLPAFISATPLGILSILERYDITTEGKHCVVLGRSNIVGLPISVLLGRKTNPGNCTVTLCHSRTANLPAHSREADILIVAMGSPEFVTKDMVKDGAVVIDVGMSRVTDETAKRGYRLKGDVKFDEVAPKCSYITPVPGGVGPMTITGLLMNTLKAAKKEIYP